MSDAARQARALFGDEQVLLGEAAHPFEQDWRGQFPGHAAGVLRPRNVDEVQAMVRWAASQGHALVPQGGNTGLVGGSTPDASGTEWVMSMRRLNAVRRVNTLNQTVVAEAGCVLAQLQADCAGQGLLLPLSMASEGSCTLGGNLATNAGGTQVLRWGNARDLCLGLEVVTADGALWTDLDALRKDHRGLNLRDLFIGSEGTLGLITAAAMKLSPLPRTRLAAWITLPDLSTAMAALASARNALGDALSGFEAMGEAAQGLLAQLPLPKAPWAVLVEMSSALDEPMARACFERWLLACGADNAVLSQSDAQFAQLWALRESLPAAQTREGGNLKHDISLPLDNLAGFVSLAEAAIQALCPGARPMPFGHLGDGNLHYNVAPPSGMALDAFSAQYGTAITQCVFELVAHLGGSFSAEHGIGRLRRAEVANRLSPVALDLMRRVKLALDPANRFNPGRLLAV